MAKIFLSLGFWMTIVLFIVLGYAFDFAHGEETPQMTNDRHPAIATSVLQDENQAAQNDEARRPCPQVATPRSNIADFQQMANLQQSGPTYAPGFSFSITHPAPEERRPSQVTACPGPIEIPRH